MTLDLTDDEARSLAALLRRTIDDDRSRSRRGWRP
jgi:hypothetical protein